MKYKMTITKDVVKSTGRQITVTVTSEDKGSQGRLKQLGTPYSITKNFGINDTADYILEVMKGDIKVAIRNFNKVNRSLVHTEMEFDV